MKLIEGPMILALGAGLRRGEIDRLLWRQVDFRNAVIHIETTEAGSLKSADSHGAVAIDGTLCSILQGFKARAKTEYILEEGSSSVDESKPWGRRYRCSAVFDRLTSWLRDYGSKAISLFIRCGKTELGRVVSFPDDLQLRELTALNAEWVTDGIYRVLNDYPLKEKRNGQLAWSELARILPADRWPESRHRYLLDLMRKFELCFPLEGEQNTELVPELLPDKTPPLDDWNPAECLVFLYQYTVLPHGVLPRFITRTHSKSQGRERWRSGVVLAREEAKAMVR